MPWKPTSPEEIWGISCNTHPPSGPKKLSSWVTATSRRRKSQCGIWGADKRKKWHCRKWCRLLLNFPKPEQIRDDEQHHGHQYAAEDAFAERPVLDENHDTSHEHND